MIYDKIEFSFGQFRYDLQFHTKISVVAGDSGTGKTYLCKALRDVKTFPQYSDIVIFDYSSSDFKDNLKQQHGKFIVIDNAEILLDTEVIDVINSSLDNQYLLMTRKIDGLDVSIHAVYHLEEENNRIFLKGEFDELFSLD